MEAPPKDKPIVISAESFAKKDVFKYSFVNPKIIALLTVIVLLIGGVGTGVYLIKTPGQTSTQASSEKLEISLKPSELEVVTGAGFDIDVFGNADKNQITSVDLVVQYDSQALELLSITPKQFLPKVLTPPNIASGSATISLGADGTAGVPGSGVLATFSFRALAQPPTSSQIIFDTEKTKINTLGNSENLQVDFRGSSVTIIDSSKNNSIPSSSDSAQLQDQTTASDSGTLESDESEFDFNSDSQINSLDLSLLYSAWGNPESELQKKADLNGDGVVNGLDYAQFLPRMKR